MLLMRTIFNHLCEIVRMLARRSFESPQGLPVPLKDGTLTYAEDERQVRWSEHFADVFGAKRLPLDDVVSHANPAL